MKARSNRSIIAAAILCAAAGVFLSHRTEPDVVVRDALLPGDTPALHFLPAGPGPHPVALLAHGVTASKETLFRLGEALAAAGFESYAVDLPGHGASTQRFTYGGPARAIEEAARALGPVDVFAGHSMGAYAGGAAVRSGSLNPRLFIALGALPDLGAHGPPLLLLAGRFEEAFPPIRLRARTDARLVISPWSDHAAEPYDARLVNAAVGAACGAVGRVPPAAPTRWRWRLAGLGLALLGAVGLGLGLPALSHRWAWMRGPLVSLLAVAALALTAQPWLDSAPHLKKAPVQAVVMILSAIVFIVAGKLGVPRWTMAALAALAAAFFAILGIYFFTLFLALGAMVFIAGAGLGAIAARRGSRLAGDLAMAIFTGYAIGQWMPVLF